MNMPIKRAAILIGVDKTGDLPELKDAAKGVHRMQAWAKQQKMAPIRVFTDDKGKTVNIAGIKQAIKRIVEAGNIDQLVIYFAGHGVNIRYGEYWLLSEAPSDTQAAVNVEGSVVLARNCGIPHIVLISDSCRTAAEGIRAQYVTGSEIFPNDESDGPERPVDQFFACRLGRPSHEIKDPRITTREFSGLYTDVLRRALSGEWPELLEWPEDESDVALLRPRRLHEFLQVEVTERLKKLNLQHKVIQVPDARLPSDDRTAWISRITSTDLSMSEGLNALPVPSPPIETPPTAMAIATSLVRSALTDNSTELSRKLDDTRSSGVTGAEEFVVSAERIAKPFGPTHIEGGSGFKIRGARFIEARSVGAQTEPINTARDVVRVYPAAGQVASVLLVLDQQTGVVLPAIHGFIGALTVEQGELVDVAYEPLERTTRWEEFMSRAAEIRTLRAIVSSSTTRGAFRLEREEVLEVARHLEHSSGIDPTLGVYAAYAYSDIQRSDLIRQILGYMKDDLGAPVFDVAMLAGKLSGTMVTPDTSIMSQFPLLGRGWALLAAFRVSLPESVARLPRMLVPSVWTMFNEYGVLQIRRAFESGELR